MPAGGRQGLWGTRLNKIRHHGRIAAALAALTLTAAGLTALTPPTAARAASTASVTVRVRN